MSVVDALRGVSAYAKMLERYALRVSVVVVVVVAAAAAAAAAAASMKFLHSSRIFTFTLLFNSFISLVTAQCLCVVAIAKDWRY